MEEQTTITKRIEKEKKELLEQLVKIPIVQIACEKTGIGRSTYYRWRQEDEEFSQLADDAIHAGELFINDMAESQLLTAIKENNMTGIIFWLKHHHPAYAIKIELKSDSQKKEAVLTPQQEEVIQKALGVLNMKEDGVTK